MNNEIESNKESHWIKALNKSRTINNWQQAIINKHKINYKCDLKEVEMWSSNTCIRLNILVITEQTIATLFARVLKVWHLIC
jgi:hypothetical protein